MRSTFRILFYINKSKTKADGTTAILCDLKVKVVGKTEFFFSIDADYTQVKDFGVPKKGFCESKGQNGWLKIPLLACLCYLWVFEKTNMNHKNARSALALS